MLTQVWLKSVKLFGKQVNAQKESLKKISGVHEAHEKVCNENESRRIRKNVSDGTGEFIRCLWS